MQCQNPLQSRNSATSSTHQLGLGDSDSGSFPQSWVLILQDVSSVCTIVVQEISRNHICAITFVIAALIRAYNVVSKFWDVPLDLTLLGYWKTIRYQEFLYETSIEYVELLWADHSIHSIDFHNVFVVHQGDPPSPNFGQVLVRRKAIATSSQGGLLGCRLSEPLIHWSTEDHHWQFIV